MKDVLQITPREVKDTLIDMAYSLIDAGLVKKTKKFKGPGSGEQEGEEGEKKEEGGETEGEEKPKENGDVKDDDKNEDDLKKVNAPVKVNLI